MSEHDPLPIAGAQAAAVMSAAPPTIPGPLAHMAKRSAWPLVLGVLAIVVGAFGAIWSLFSAATMTLLKFTFDSGDDPAARVIRRWIWGKVGLDVVGGVLGLMLLAAGILLLGRRARGARMMGAWAWCKVMFVFASAAVTFGSLNAQLQATSDASAGMASFSGGLGTLVTTFWLLWMLVFPVVAIVWLSRPSVRDEIAQWRASKTVQEDA